MSDTAPLLQLDGLVRCYPNGVLAADGVSFEVQRGEVHALVGENGAGKSTVIKMLYGLESPDQGVLTVDGIARRFASPRDAIACGIGLVPQHLQLFGSLTVAENVVLGAEPLRRGLLDLPAARRRVQALAAQHGLEVDPQARVAGLSAGAQQRVEILRALHRGARLLLLDEPTALLSPQECDALFTSLQQLVRAGLSIVLVTHKLAEVQRVAQRFTVLRAGRVSGRGESAGTDASALASMIVGEPLPALPVARVDARGREPLLRVRGLAHVPPHGRPELLDASFDVAPGEILGIAGVEGNGQKALAEVLSGLLPASAGRADIDGHPLSPGVRRAQAMGIGCIPEDRLHGGVAPTLDIADNSTSIDYHRPPASRRGVLDLAFIRARARRLIDAFGVRARDELQPIGMLSGGNMQKVVVGRELEAQPRLLLACQPTRGVDIGAADTLRRALVGLRDGGAAVLLISADLDELLALSDRIAVLYEGRVVAHFGADQVSAREIGRYMTGLAADPRGSAVLDAPFTDSNRGRA